MAKPSEGKLLYHITHLDNIPSILENGLMPRSCLLASEDYAFKDIADQEILTKRERYKSALSQYVLFHFYAKNPFDGAVCKKYGSENMAIITINRDLHKNNNFYIIPSHPLDSDEPDIYPYEEGLQKIRWDILDMETNRNYRNNEIRKACMAECVMPYIIPANVFSFIYVQNLNAKKWIEEIAHQLNVKVSVSVNSRMFP